MKKLLALLFLCFASAAFAQSATSVPGTYTASVVNDLGNGPLKVRAVQGSAQVFTSQGSGVGSTSGSSTSLTLTAVPATAPCVGCQVAGPGIATGLTVSAFNGVTSITLSAVSTVPASSALTWGAACPGSIGSAPYLQAAPSSSFLPVYSQSRVCALASGSPYNWFLVLPYGVSSGG